MSWKANASAQEREYSPYERETIAIALDRLGGRIDDAPEGKRLERIRVISLDVFEPRDPAPAFLNALHATTRDYVIEREILLRPGQPYLGRLAAESERNLRLFPQLSVVLVIPLRGKTADSVELLVITKDVWSLRMSWQPEARNGKLTSLLLAPSETNLLGTTQSISGVLSLEQHVYSVGGRYYVPRVGGSRIAALVSGNGVFNCQTDKLEGGNAYVRYGQPLYSSLARWAWQTALFWSSSLPRLSTQEGVCSGGRTTTTSQFVPDSLEVYESFRSFYNLYYPNLTRSETLRGQFNVTRSFNRYASDGSISKLNISAGAELDWRTIHREVPPDPSFIYRIWHRQDREQKWHYGGVALTQRWPESRTLPFGLPGDDQLNAAQRSFFRGVALWDRRVSPYLQLRAFSNTFARLINYNRLGLQEDVQVGHDLYLRLYPALRPLSSRDMLGVFASASYTQLLGGGLWRALAATTVERAEPQRSDVTLRGAVHLVTPNLGLGRVVSTIDATHRPRSYLLGRTVLGGGTVSESSNDLGGGTGRLRGFSPSAFWGYGVATFNTELRSRPLRVFSFLTGFSLFHDLGLTVQDGLSDPRLRHGGGIGLRFLAPQLDRDVFRIDLGVPLGHPRADNGEAEVSVIASFGQAFGTPTTYPSVLLVQ